MVAPLAIAGGVAAAGALSSLIGGRAASKESAAARAQATEFTNRALAALEEVGIPTIEAQKIVLENPQEVFKYVPQLQQEFPELKTAFDEVSTDPRLKELQTQALSGLQQRADTGLTSEEQAEISALRRGTAQQANARDASILQNLEQRGMGGSGQELLSRLASSQAAAQQASIDSENEAKLIAQRRLEALQQLGSMASSQQAQQFQQAGQIASARDVINQANLANKMNIQASNVGEQNKAALLSAEMKQQLENQRAATANQQEMYNKGLSQQRFENEMTKAGAASSALTGAAQGALQAGATSAANKQAMWSGLGQAAMGGAQLYGSLSKKEK